MCILCLLLQTYFLPVIGLVDPEDMKPADLVVCSHSIYLSPFSNSVYKLTFGLFKPIYLKHDCLLTDTIK